MCIFRSSYVVLARTATPPSSRGLVPLGAILKRKLEGQWRALRRGPVILVQQAEDRLVPDVLEISRCNERRFLLWCDARVRIKVKIRVVHDAEAELVDFLLRLGSSFWKI